ncbi:MAG: hypothetical protein ACK4V1_06205 [Burkholderiaceae bacterium]
MIAHDGAVGFGAAPIGAQTRHRRRHQRKAAQQKHVQVVGPIGGGRGNIECLLAVDPTENDDEGERVRAERQTRADRRDHVRAMATQGCRLALSTASLPLGRMPTTPIAGAVMMRAAG